MNGHLPAHRSTKIYVQWHLWEHRSTHCLTVTTNLLYSTSQGTTAGSVCCNHLKLILDQPSDQNAVECAELLCCCSMIALGHILHTSVLLQWPHTAYQCVVTVSTYCISMCCYSGHILHISVLLRLDSTRPYTAYHCVVTVATYCISVCCNGMTVLGHILHTFVLLQCPHTAYQCVVTVATCCLEVCCYSGHTLHISVLLQWPHTAYQCVVTVATYCIPVCCWSLAYL